MINPELIVVMPVYNEQDSIAAVLTEWLQALRSLELHFAFIVVNDGSKDKTLEIIETFRTTSAPEVQLIDKPNSGHGRSCRVGYEAALQHNPSWVFQIDSDGQCDPKFFPQFWNARHEADCILGDRVSRDDGPMRVFISFWCRVLLWCFSGSYVRDPNVPYRLMHASALGRALERIPPDFDLQNIALALALKRDRSVRSRFLPIHFRARQGGENSINFQSIVRKGFAMLNDLRRIR
jgi:glycosyltransferase involved in cell wall biosynthesis